MTICWRSKSPTHASTAIFRGWNKYFGFAISLRDKICVFANKLSCYSITGVGIGIDALLNRSERCGHVSLPSCWGMRAVTHTTHYYFDNCHKTGLRYSFKIDAGFATSQLILFYNCRGNMMRPGYALVRALETSELNKEFWDGGTVPESIR